MKNKIYITAFPELQQSFIKRLPHDVLVMSDLDVVLKMVKNNEVDKVCIYMDADNCLDMPFKCVRGQGAAERIHKLDSSIQIIVWNGREFDSTENLDSPPVFQLTGKVKPIINKEELYMDYYSAEEIVNITTMFFSGDLKDDDVFITEYLQVSFLQ